MGSHLTSKVVHPTPQNQITTLTPHSTFLISITNTVIYLAFMYLFNKYLLSTYIIPRTVLENENTAEKRIRKTWCSCSAWLADLDTLLMENPPICTPPPEKKKKNFCS